MAKLDTVVTPDNLVPPPELLLRCFSYMSLKCLISSRCVCSHWRQLIPQSDLHPTRRRFLELYDKMLANPLFLQSRTWTMDNLKPFDRQAYIATLNEQCNAPEAEIPEDFRMYILEYPARMAIGCMWPGLPFIESRTRNIQRQYGLTALVILYNFQLSCSNINSPRRVLSLDSSYGVLQNLRIGSYSIKLTIGPSPLSMDLSSLLTCIRIHPLWH